MLSQMGSVTWAVPKLGTPGVQTDRSWGKHGW